jgi:hypothetical protein
MEDVLDLYAEPPDTHLTVVQVSAAAAGVF